MGTTIPIAMIGADTFSGRDEVKAQYRFLTDADEGIAAAFALEFPNTPRCCTPEVIRHGRHRWVGHPRLRASGPAAR